MLYYALIVPECALLFLLLARYRFDPASLALFAGAVALCTLQFSSTHWDQFSLDATLHGQYVSHIALAGDLPTTDETGAARHENSFAA